MKIIDKIEIYRFRSFSNETILCNEINVFSGINNAGKSNILKALNLFFRGESGFNQKYNHAIDYNKSFTESAGGARKIEISLYFNGQGKGALKKDFIIHREFIEGHVGDPQFESTEQSINQEIKKKNGKILRQFRRFFNRLDYIYIPTFRDKLFIQEIFTRLDELIRKNEKGYHAHLANLAKKLSDRTLEIGNEFEKFIGLPTKVETPTSILDILRTMQIQTEPGIQVKKKKGKGTVSKNVNIYSSGDGIVMAYLPYFLTFLSKELKNKIYIWGFEEPENSLEYSKAQNLSGKFLNEFSSNAQIFITTHSPAFINLKKETRVKFYRVYKENWSQSKLSRIEDIKSLEEKIENERRQSHLFFDQNESAQLKQSQEKINVFRKELALAEFSSDIEEYIENQRKITEQLLAKFSEVEKVTRPVVFLEGKFDSILLKIAYEKLGGRKKYGDFEIYEPDEDNSGDGAKNLVYLLKNHLGRFRTKKIIGIFDKDEKGMAEFNSLSNFTVRISDGIIKKDNNDLHAAMLLIIPSSITSSSYSREDFLHDGTPVTKYCFEIEDYLSLDEKCKAHFTRNMPGFVARKVLSKKALVDFVTKNQDSIDFSLFRELLLKIKEAFSEKGNNSRDTSLKSSAETLE